MIDNADAAKYCDCMEEVKLRTGVITNFLNRQSTTGYRMTDLEFLCLQFRKVLELIALASLTANKDEYARQHQEFSKHWNAKRILEAIEKINPHFYPIPGQQIIDKQTGKMRVKPLDSGFLTKDEFVDLYDMSSRCLHSPNPYGTAVDLERLEVSFDVWLAKVKCLLAHHQVQLPNKEYQLWVIMQNKEDGRVHAATMKEIDASELPL